MNTYAEPTATPPPEPTAAPTPRPEPTAAPDEFYVQVVAVARRASVEEARTKLEGLGFTRERQHLITVQDPGSPALYKLRIGPFPDRSSADRVAKRMSAAGFQNAWVVAP